MREAKQERLVIRKWRASSRQLRHSFPVRSTKGLACSTSAFDCSNAAKHAREPVWAGPAWQRAQADSVPDQESRRRRSNTVAKAETREHSRRRAVSALRPSLACFPPRRLIPQRPLREKKEGKETSAREGAKSRGPGRTSRPSQRPSPSTPPALPHQPVRPRPLDPQAAGKLLCTTSKPGRPGQTGLAPPRVVGCPGTVTLLPPDRIRRRIWTSIPARVVLTHCGRDCCPLVGHNGCLIDVHICSLSFPTVSHHPSPSFHLSSPPILAAVSPCQPPSPCLAYCRRQSLDSPHLPTRLPAAQCPGCTRTFTCSPLRRGSLNHCLRYALFPPHPTHCREPIKHET